MERYAQALGEVIADLKLIKEAVSKSDNIIRFIDTRGALKGVLLGGGLIIALFSLAFYVLVSYYGTFAAIPFNIRTTLFILIGLAWCIIGYLKIFNILKGARKIREGITISTLLAEIYTPILLALIVPYMLVIILTTIFLGSNGHLNYIVPALAILFGLLIISMSLLFYMKAFYFLSLWLIATGLLFLFTATIFHPLIVLVLTFSAGFILAALLLFLNLPGRRS
ncbi:MAG TPA: hypothetical protein VLH18_03320 [Candidatus Limnocylindrales bacterium]|nr:hypothetical protein [Candidatus Limnocylindrales bacterium]